MVLKVSPLFFIGDYMEKRTFYIHQTKEERDKRIESAENDEYRVVTFINGNKDILHIIKQLIKTSYQA